MTYSRLPGQQDVELDWSSGNPEQTFSFSPDLLDTPPPPLPQGKGPGMIVKVQAISKLYSWSLVSLDNS